MTALHPPEPAELLVGLDADDTLWHSEVHFELTQAKVRQLLAPNIDIERFDAQLLAVERRNLGFFGYGVKGFALSLVETAIEVTDGRIPARDIGAILEWAKEMMSHPVELLDHVAEVVPAVARAHRVVVITKGDLFHQEAKVAASGLAEHFEGVEIVSEKAVGDYRKVLDRYGVEPSRFVMVGNSLRSDVLPVVELGGWGVHVPYEITWALEHAELPDPLADRVVRLDDLGQLPATLRSIAAQLGPRT